MKNIFDIFFALILTVVLSPLLLLTAMLVLLFDGSPALFIQDRTGTDKCRFRLLKFRTMRDGKVTRVGKYLRACCLDELPQVMNVLRGEMSFIGPRPLTDFDIKRLGWDTDEHNARWTVKPGITGLAQLAPICDQNLSWHMDLNYIRNRSVLLDFKILVMTFAMVIVGKKRYGKQLWRMVPVEYPG